MNIITIQIAIFGTFCVDNILTGLKICSKKLVLICYDHDNSKAKYFCD